MPPSDYLKKHGVIFYFPEKEFHPENIHYAAACLTEGLQTMSIPIYANVEHPLFIKREILDCREGIIVFYVTENNYSEALMTGIAQFKARHKIILSMADIHTAILTPPNVPSLITHENRFLEIKGHRLPWVFGLSQPRIKAASAEPPFAERQRVLLRNFRPSHGQSVRAALDLVLLPHLEKHFQIDHHIAADHFPRLARSLGCLAYGGQFVSDLNRNSYFATDPTNHGPLTFRQDPLIVRWDSWRFWESLAAGCLTFQLDCEKYGFQLPVMPRAWEDYIPVDLSDPKGTVARLMELEPRWAEIATNGKKWALTHYAPAPTALRFLTLVNQLYPA